MKHRFSLFAVLIILSLTVTSCSRIGLKNESSIKSGNIKIYDLNENQDGLVTEDYEIKNMDSVYSQVRELMEEMKGKAAKGDMSRPIPKDIEYQDFVYDDKIENLIVSFSRTYTTLDPTKESLIRAAVSMTLLQIDGVSEVTFMVEHEPLKSFRNDGTIISAMTPESFVLSMEGEDSKTQEAELMLYYPSKNGDGLYAEPRKVEYSSNMSLERVVLKHLSDSPSNEDAMPAMPSSVSILNMYVADGTCYINMDGSFLNQTNDDSLKYRVYSVVNSLTSLARINRVQISCNGENVKLAGSDNSTDILYSRNDFLTLNDPYEED